MLNLKLDGWQLLGRIATTAIRHALPSSQYGLWVKCGPAGIWSRAVGQKGGGAAVLLNIGGLDLYLTHCRLGRGLLPYQVVS